MPARGTPLKRLSGAELIAQLNAMVAQLINDNRKLRRQVAKLTERGASAATTKVERGLRTISRRVQRELAETRKPKRRKAAPAAKSRKPAVRRRKTA